MKKVVVTGGAGFIGSHLLEELARRDYSLLVIDDFSTGKQENISSVLKKPNVTIIHGSIIDLPLLQKSFKDVDYVFHLAAVASVPRSIDEPQLCHDTNITGTLNVLIAARDNKVKKVINTSSCSVYGDAPGLPKKEDMVKNPVSPYAVSKLAGEYYCQVFQNIYQLPTVSLRLFNIFGPRQDPDSDYANAIPRFIKLFSPRRRLWPGSNTRRKGAGNGCGDLAFALWQGKGFANPIACAQKSRDRSMGTRCKHGPRRACRYVARPALQGKPKIRP